MKPPCLLLAALGALVLAAPAFAAAKKSSPVAVRFHAEGGTEGGSFSQPVELINPKRMTNMQSLPLITEREITAFYPFQAPDGSGTFGASFRLDSHGTNLLAEHTMSRRGSYLLAYFNGRHVIDLYVDRPVTDGIVSIPTGLSANDISLLEIAFPVMGREKEKTKKKDPKVAPTPLPKAVPIPRPQPAMLRLPDGSLVPAPTSGVAPRGDVVPKPVSPVGQ